MIVDFRLTDEEADRYLENRRRKGFNSIVVNLINTSSGVR
jgi:hypothetical protein